MSNQPLKDEAEQQLQQQQQQAATTIKYLNPFLTVRPYSDNAIKLISVSEEKIREIRLPTLSVSSSYRYVMVEFELGNTTFPLIDRIIEANTLYSNSVAAHENNNTFQPFTNVSNIFDTLTNLVSIYTHKSSMVKTYDITIYYIHST